MTFGSLPARGVFDARAASLGISCLLVFLLGAASVSDSTSREDAGECRARPMLCDPPLPQPAPIFVFDRANIPLWLQAMNRPEAEIRMNAIEAVGAAHRRGVRGLSEAVPAIQKLLATDPHADVRHAAARTLGELDARSAAEALRQVAKNADAPTELLLVVDPILARWQDTDSIPGWIVRVQASPRRPAATISAVRSLGSIGARQASEALFAVVRNADVSPVIRLEAARALAAIAPPGRSELASELAAEAGEWGSLIALLLLGSDRENGPKLELDATGLNLAASLLFDPDARVRGHALSLVRRADNARARAKPELLNDSDDQVRFEAVMALAQAPASAPVTEQLMAALNDLSEAVRVAARKGLVERWIVDSPGVQQGLARVLGSDNWRELEQGASIVGEVGFEAARPRLEALLRFDRPEVRLAACTALRQLNRPESLPALLNRAEELTALAPESSKVPARLQSEAEEISQIFMLFAQQKHKPVLELLAKYVPKRSGFHPLARGAAIYALGKIFESAPPSADLVSKLLARAEDNNPIDPEDAGVRRFSIIALGRFGSRDVLPALRDLYEAENTVVSVGGAARWSVMHIEGVELPPCRPVEIKSGPFFLEALGPRASAGQP